MSRPVTLALGIVLAIVVGALVWWGLDRPEPEVPQPTVATPTPVVELEPEDVNVALPPLDGSDAFVRDQLIALGIPGPLVDGLQGTDLVRTFVVAVNRVADGNSPRRQLGFLEPDGYFSVVARDDKLYIDPASYRRYDPLVVALGALDSRSTAGVIRRLQPLMEAAQAELGTGEPFESVLMRAMQVLLETPALTADIEVVDAIERYRFVDAALEALAPAQKHLLRMGPANTEALQGQLRAIRGALATLPAGR